MKFLPQFALPREGESRKGLYLLFSEDESLLACPVNENSEPLGLQIFSKQSELPLSDLIENLSLLMVGEWRGKTLWAGSVDGETPLPDGWGWVPFFEIYINTGGEIQSPLSRSKQILTWDRTHRFCGSCGTTTEQKGSEPCRVCPACGQLSYPPISPAVIVLISRGDQILLAHNKNFPDDLYSNIAGFVDAGENLEEAVHREIYEEVSLKVENVRYFGSQPWPMPHSLMVGFTAECPEGEPIPDGVEIIDAQWFSRENLPLLPGEGSIARRMIDDFFATRGLF